MESGSLSTSVLIRDLTPREPELMRQAAAMLVDAFREHWPQAWPSTDAALEELRTLLDGKKICRVAIVPEGRAAGWIGGLPHYDGRVWEIHPLVVDGPFRGQGIGRALVEDFGKQASKRGGLTVWVGTDDESGMTSLAGADLSANPLESLMKIRNLRGHPYEFYLKCGFSLSGVMPDANGPGKPDIYLAKQIRSPHGMN